LGEGVNQARLLRLKCKSQTFCSNVLALISLGVLRAKDSCESQARYRPLAAGAHEMKRPGSWRFDPG
jgi:hypothetical protein